MGRIGNWVIVIISDNKDPEVIGLFDNFMDAQKRMEKIKLGWNDRDWHHKEMSVTHWKNK